MFANARVANALMTEELPSLPTCQRIDYRAIMYSLCR